MYLFFIKTVNSVEESFKEGDRVGCRMWGGGRVEVHEEYEGRLDT